MKRVKIIVLFLFLISLSSLIAAQEIELDFPEVVNFGEEFEIDLNLINFSEDIYDVKIDILGEGSRLSKILNDDIWQSTYNYVESIIDFPDDVSETFRLNITENFNGVANIEVKIRDSGGGIKIFEGYQITINSASIEEEEIGTYFELDWDEEDIVNGETFKVEIKSFNLDDNEYDIRIWIEEDSSVISDRYDEDKEEWKSGSYYLDKFFDNDSGNNTKEVRLRIREQYDHFDGIARLVLKIRGGNTTRADIEVLEPEEKDPEVIDILQGTPNKLESKEDGAKDSAPEDNIIRLGVVGEPGEEAEEIEERVAYESKNEIIKKYIFLCFAILCAALAVLFAWNKIH